MSYYNTAQGTWVITGTFSDSILLDNTGVYINAVSGTGAVVVTYDGTEAKVFASGSLQYTTAPPNAADGGGIVLVENGVARMANAVYYPRKLTDAEAVDKASGGVVVEWNPNVLFAAGQQGAWYEPIPVIDGQQSLYQDAAATTPVTADGDPVGWMRDLSGNGHHATQSTSADRPIYRTDGTLHWLEGNGTNQFMDSLSLVPYNGSAFYIASAIAITGGSTFPGPWRFLRDGGSPTGSTDNILEEYTEQPTPHVRKAVFQRHPVGVTVYDNNTARPASGVNHVSWQTNGAVVKQQVIPSQSTISDLGSISLSSGDATLSLFRGYSGQRMQGRMYGMIWQSSTPADEDRDKANQYLMDVSGVTL